MLKKWLTLVFVLCAQLIYTQHLDLVNNRVTGTHNGNLIRTKFTNYGNIGVRNENPNMEWPKGSGLEYGLEFVMFAGARVIDPDLNQYFIFTESSTDPYNLDEDPTGTYTYSWEPLPGYYNTLMPSGQQTVAMSNIPESWPSQWLHDYPGDAGSRDGMWNGEYKAAPIADQESYYVMVDWNNMESDYVPFPADSTKGGLGLQVKVRNYQWADPLAEDILISIYDITNVSDKNLPNVVFGMYVDADVDGPLNDVMSFDPTGDINITYQWDKVSGQTGYFGFAFLESPGIASDGYDNDDDGLIDEKRDNGRGEWVENDASSYMLSHYGQPRSHWSGDEDGDWDERYHDTGSDGLLPGEEYYPGPDTDGTEGNGMPDDGEPNFDRTDLTESDQIGLTSFTPSTVNYRKLKNDQVLYDRTVPQTFQIISAYGGQITPRKEIDLRGNAEFVYGSAYFPLKPGQTERFSIATVYGNNEDDILGNKQIMQQIYDNNYQFATPPIKPTMYAYAKDKQVILSWDDVAESSYDPLYGYDFEGYIIYKATDPEFNEIKTITDNLGNPFYYEPLVQFDLKDGLAGPHQIAAGAEITGDVDESGTVVNREIVYEGNGAHLEMGTDTGLRHVFVDNDVQNGRTYYYAVVAYDKGYDFDFYQRGFSDRNPRDGFKPVYPVQNSKTITQDVVGNIIFNDRNTAIVVPNSPSAGTEFAEIDSSLTHYGPATGNAEIVIAQPDSLKPGHLFQLSFTDTLAHRKTNHYLVTDLADNTVLIDRLYPEPSALAVDAIVIQDYEQQETGIFDGLDMIMENHLPTNVSGYWRPFQGVSSDDPEQREYRSLEPETIFPTRKSYFYDEFGSRIDSVLTFENPYPAKVEITFYQEIVDTTLGNYPEYRIPIHFMARISDTGEKLRILALTELPFGTLQTFSMITVVKKIDSLYYAMASVLFADEDHDDGGPFVLPGLESMFTISPDQFNFTSDDSYTFSIKAAERDITRSENEMDKIAVVPDPYIASASWEKPLFFTSGRGERRVDFIHLPPVCTIRIFTLDGKLVRKLEHLNPIEDGHESWDLTSKDGLDVAFGIYLYHVETPEGASKKGRFALIK